MYFSKIIEGMAQILYATCLISCNSLEQNINKEKCCYSLYIFEKKIYFVNIVNIL